MSPSVAEYQKRGKARSVVHYKRNIATRRMLEGGRCWHSLQMTKWIRDKWHELTSADLK